MAASTAVRFANSDGRIGVMASMLLVGQEYTFVN